MGSCVAVPWTRFSGLRSSDRQVWRTRDAVVDVTASAHLKSNFLCLLAPVWPQEPIFSHLVSP